MVWAVDVGTPVETSVNGPSITRQQHRQLPIRNFRPEYNTSRFSCRMRKHNSTHVRDRRRPRPMALGERILLAISSGFPRNPPLQRSPLPIRFMGSKLIMITRRRSIPLRFTEREHLSPLRGSSRCKPVKRAKDDSPWWNEMEPGGVSSYLKNIKPRMG
jgi:hypothetical protein